MPQDNFLRVVQTREVTVIDSQKGPQAHYEVQYMVGPHGPFFERFAKDGFDARAARQVLEQKAYDMVGFTGLDRGPLQL
jgi:hypothetical protein